MGSADETAQTDDRAGEERIESEEDRSDDDDDHENDGGIDRDVLRCDPDDLLEFRLKSAEPSGDSGAERRLVRFRFCSFFRSLIDLFGFFGGGFFDVSHFLLLSLFRFSVQRVLAAETAILVHFETIGIVLFVLFRIVVTLFAFTASESDLDSHLSAPP